MECVYEGDKIPDAFEEHAEFSENMPYTIHIKKFPVDELVPLHYAETIEILVCRDLVGEVNVGTEHYSLNGKQVFAVPPYTIHSSRIQANEGLMYVLKISPIEMKRYFDIFEYVRMSGCTMDQLGYLCAEPESIAKSVERLIQKDGDFRECFLEVVKIFYSLLANANPKKQKSGSNLQFGDFSLQELIEWTNQHYTQKITIEQVAAKAGYSKYYFCSRFKALTGTTYMSYLNNLRVSRACLLLQRGDSVQMAAADSGFADVSYFIQLFKKEHHITPAQYALQYRKNK